MRFIFKTDYEDDIRLVPHSGYVWTYGTLLVLLALAPFMPHSRSAGATKTAKD